jgi:hypothetical protein
MRSSNVKVASLPLGETDCETSIVPKKFTIEPAGMLVEEFTSIFSIETCRPKLSECNNEGSISETTRIKHLNIWSIIFPILQ